MAAESVCINSCELEQSVKTGQLELAYERALREAERIYEEERVRALRVQLLLLEQENDELQEQAEKDEDEQQHMEDANEELQAHLAEVEANLQQSQMDLKARLRDLDHLRAEADSLNASRTDATKMHTEKLALTRELNNLKPELEHLRSQSSTSQKLLSEKLALQREVGSLQVELETEQRAVQRIKAREQTSSREDNASIAEVEGLKKELVKAKRDASKNSSAREETAAEVDGLKKELAQAQRDAQKQPSYDGSALTVEIEGLRKEMAKTQRDAQKTDRETRKRVTEWENEKEVLDGKLDAFRNKLRTTKEQLHEAHEEIEKLQTAKMAQSAELTKARMNGTAAANARKRSVARFDPDMTLGTPGNGGPASKKPRISVSVGDKSTFSITPFLNRTLSTLPETPAEEEDQPPKKDDPAAVPQVDGADDETGKVLKVQVEKKKPAIVRKVAGPAAAAKALKPLKETTNAKVNTTMKKPQLAKLVEEDSEVESDNGDINASESANKENTEHTQTTANDTTQPLKKPKRANIFDEIDSAPPPRIRTLGGSAGLGGLGRINLKAKPVGKGRTLAEFSPLKKDRRAASFLE